MFVLLSLCLFLTSNFVYSAPTPTDTYANSIILQTPDMYYLFWNYTETDIIFEIHVKTTGWAGFGISPNGGMDGSDVVIFWVDTEGKSHFTDRHINGRSVIVDKTQNWFPIVVSWKDGYLMSKFTRKIKICDKSNEDIDISEGTPFTIFAYGTKMLNGDITYHDFRGIKTLPLISSLNRNVNVNMDELQLETVEFRVNTTLDPTYSTIYYCQFFKIPADWISLKRHLIRYETLYTQGTENHYHHWTVNECSKEFETVFLKNNSIPDPGYCVMDDKTPEYMKQAISYCGKVSLVWAVGSSVIQDFPDDFAYPIGGSDSEFKYFYLEIHYNNPDHIPNLVDNSGFKMYVTKNYRKTEFGVLTVGHSMESWSGLIIPPNAEKFNTIFGCGKNCTNSMLSEQNEIKIFSSMPHTHLIGKEVYTTLIRDGKEIAYITNNKNYDFNYQYYNFLTNPVTIRKGDELKLTCVYGTKSKSTFTYGGYGTNEEMCYSFMWYYPRVKDLSFCTENYDIDHIKDFLKKLTDDGLIKSSNFSSDNVKLSIEQTDPTANLASRFEELYTSVQRYQSCNVPGDTKYYLADAPKAIPMDEPVCTTSNDLQYMTTTANTPMMNMDSTTSSSSQTTTTSNNSMSFINFNYLFVFISVGLLALFNLF